MPFASSYVYDAPIVAVELGIIGRGIGEVGTGNDKTMKSSFNLQGAEYQIREKTPHYIRRTLQRVITLRNSRLSQ